MEREEIERVAGLVEEELWFPRFPLMTRSTNAVTTFAGGAFMPLFLPVLVAWALVALPSEVVQAARLRRELARRRTEIEALVAQLERLRRLREGSGDSASYRGSALAQALAKAPPGVAFLASGAGPAVLLEYVIQTEVSRYVNQRLNGFCLVSLAPTTLVAHVWGFPANDGVGSSMWVWPLAARVKQCLARCSPLRVPVERWTWNLGERSSLAQIGSS